MNVNLYQMFDTDSLIHRESARQVVANLPKDAQITIDFTNITFASRSFLHELLCNLGNRKVVFEHRNADIIKMMEIAQTGIAPEIC